MADAVVSINGKPLEGVKLDRIEWSTKPEPTSVQAPYQQHEWSGTMECGQRELARFIHALDVNSLGGKYWWRRRERQRMRDNRTHGRRRGYLLTESEKLFVCALANIDPDAITEMRRVRGGRRTHYDVTCVLHAQLTSIPITWTVV